MFRTKKEMDQVEKLMYKVRAKFKDKLMDFYILAEKDKKYIGARFFGSQNTIEAIDNMATPQLREILKDNKTLSVFKERNKDETWRYFATIHW